MENKIVFYGLQSSLVEISGFSVTGKVSFGLYETEKERDCTIKYLQYKNNKNEVIPFYITQEIEVIPFYITQEIMDLFNLKTKEDVEDKLRKEFEKTRNKIGGIFHE